MRLGIDFGTTRTVVAMEDRGNYPLVAFKDGRGSWAEWFPSRVAARGGELVFGHEAEALVGEPDVWHLASFKRLLGSAAAADAIEIPGVGTLSVSTLLARFLGAVRDGIAEGLAGAEEAGAGDAGAFDATVSVPANANGTQRFVTLDAFARAGFRVLGMLNEPSAAAVEYSHRYLKRPEAPRSREYVAVYDLGGGTFDAAAIRIAGMRHEVVSSEGVSRLGGDDFDRVLLDMVVERLGLGGGLGDGLGGGLGCSLDAATEARLLAECRERKEGLNPNTKRILVDAGEAGEAVVDAAEYYARCQPLVDRTIACLDDLMARLPDAGEAGEGGLPRAVATVYLVGGSASFPLVARALKERYGRRVQRSPYPHGAVAIGLAVASNPDERYFVRETLTRHFGVWREAEGGSRVVFDPIFAKDTALEEAGRLRVERRYHPAHNVGHFRFLECGGLGDDGEPSCDLTPWDAISFPFAEELRDRSDLDALAVERVEPSPSSTVVEEYSVDEAGIVRVRLREEQSGFERSYELTGSLAGRI